MARALWILLGFSIISLFVYLFLSTPLTLIPDFKHVDKVIHAIAYTFLMLWFTQIYKGKTRYLLGVSFIVMGVIIEFIQPMYGREFSYLDMVVNAFGVLLGLLIASRGGDFLYPRLCKHG